MNLNYYEVLGVPKHASDEEVKSAYRKLAMQHHPDRNQNSKLSEEIFKKVQIAFEHLSDPVKRKEHDECLMGLRPFPREPVQQPPYEEQHTTQAGGPTYTSVQGMYPHSAPKSRKGLFFFLLLLLILRAGGLFYWYKTPHVNTLDAATPSLFRPVDPQSMRTQVNIKALSTSDSRIDAAMQQIYGSNYLQNSASKCWVAGTDPQSGKPYCMQMFSAFLISMEQHELLYLQIMEKNNAERLAQRETNHFPITLGAAVYDTDNAQLLAYAAHMQLPGTLSGKEAFLAPTQIACNGALGWPVGFNSQQAILLAQNGSSIVDIFQKLPARYLDGLQYKYTFLPAPEGCVYEVHIESRKNPMAAPAIAVFDQKTWSYHII